LSALVVDASAVLVLLTADDGGEIADRMTGADLAAPELLGFEVANVLRRQWSAGILTKGQAELALAGYRDLSIDLWPFDALADGAWRVRGQLSFCDASYVSLALLLGCALLTCDARLGRAVRQAVPQAQVEVV
jgi:predicted nucleic acid-binding protein